MLTLLTYDKLLFTIEDSSILDNLVKLNNTMSNKITLEFNDTVMTVMTLLT